jgi:hypothetical protein
LTEICGSRAERRPDSIDQLYYQQVKDSRLGKTASLSFLAATGEHLRNFL